MGVRNQEGHEKRMMEGSNTAKMNKEGVGNTRRREEIRVG